MWQTHVVKLYLKLLQEASNMDTLEASAGAIQNLAACQFAPSAEHRRLPNHQQVSPASQNSERRNDNPHHEPLYASVRKGERTRDVNDSWDTETKRTIVLYRRTPPGDVLHLTVLHSRKNHTGERRCGHGSKKNSKEVGSWTALEESSEGEVPKHRPT